MDLSKITRSNDEKFNIKIGKSVTSYDRESGKKIKSKILDEEVREVDARLFFMPIMESFEQRVLKEAVIEIKNDLYGYAFGLDPDEEDDDELL